jgi:hypothetical protein
VFKVVGSDEKSALATDVSVVENESSIVVENANLKFTINKTTGNIPSLINKKDNNHEVFYQTSNLEGNELQFKTDTGGSSFPAWDMTNSEFGGVSQVFTRVNTAYETPSIIVNTPEKVVVKVVHRITDAANTTPSVATRYITLLAGSDRIDVRFELDWQMFQRNLKLAFPVAENARGASYEIAYGALDGAKEVERQEAVAPTTGNGILQANSITGAPAYAGAVGRSTLRDSLWNSARFEQSGHKWMDITGDNKEHGMSLLDDAKYGYDVLKMAPSTTTGHGVDADIEPGESYVRTRMTVVRSPMSANNDYETTRYQPSNQIIDIGYQDFNYAIYPHSGTWQDAGTSREAAEVNYPLTSFQASPGIGDGILGKDKSFMSVDKSNVQIGAVKNEHVNQEERNTFIVRLWETNGADTEGVKLTLPSAVSFVKEVNMIETDYTAEDNIDPEAKQLVAKPVAINGSNVTFDIGKYEVLTLLVKLAPYAGTQVDLDQQTVSLAGLFNTRGTSSDSARRAGSIDGLGNSIPEPLWKAAREKRVDYEGIKFDLGPDAANNFVAAQGQTVPVNEGGYNRIYLLGVSAGNGVKTGKFVVNYADETFDEKEITFADWKSPLTGWVPTAKMDMNPYTYDSIAQVFTHWHDGATDQMTLDNYLYAYSIDADSSKTIANIQFPVASAIKIAGVSAAYSPIPGFASVYEASEADKPGVPTNVVAEELTETMTHDIKVAWEAPVDSSVRSYIVYAGLTPDFDVSEGILAGTSSGSVLSFNYRPAVRGTFYFKVIAVGTTSVSSAPSAVSEACSGGVYNYCLPDSRADMWANASVNTGSEYFTNASDGNDSTKWCVTSAGTNNINMGLYVKLVADDVPNGDGNENLPLITGFRVYGNESTSYIASRFYVQALTDLQGAAGSTTWRTQAPWGNATNNPSATATPGYIAETRKTGNTNGDVFITLSTPVRARYLRLVIDRGESGSGTGFATIRLFEFSAFGMTDMAQPPSVTNAKLEMDYDAEASSVSFEAKYDLTSVSVVNKEYGTTYEWAIKGSDGEYTPLPEFTGKSIKAPSAILNASDAIKVTVTPKTSNGKVGEPVDIEYAYRAPDVNVLLGKKLVATSGAYAENEAAGNLVNGVKNATDKWCQRYTDPGGVNSPAYATFDMTGVYEINGFSLYHNYYSRTTTGGYDDNAILNTKAYKVEYSLDGEAWYQAVYETNNTASSSEHTLDEPVLARFLRLVVVVPNSCTNNTSPTMEGDFAATRIQEFEALGSFVQFGLPNAISGASYLASGSDAELAGLAGAAGKDLTVRVGVANDYSAAEIKTASVVAALFDAQDKLAYANSGASAIEPDAVGEVVLTVPVPADPTGYTLQTFVWQAGNYAPVGKPYKFR